MRWHEREIRRVLWLFDDDRSSVRGLPARGGGRPPDETCCCRFPVSLDRALSRSPTTFPRSEGEAVGLSPSGGLFDLVSGRIEAHDVLQAVVGRAWPLRSIRSAGGLGVTELARRAQARSAATVGAVLVVVVAVAALVVATQADQDSDGTGRAGTTMAARSWSGAAATRTNPAARTAPTAATSTVAVEGEAPPRRVAPSRPARTLQRTLRPTRPPPLLLYQRRR